VTLLVFTRCVFLSFLVSFLSSGGALCVRIGGSSGDWGKCSIIDCGQRKKFWQWVQRRQREELPRGHVEESLVSVLERLQELPLILSTPICGGSQHRNTGMERTGVCACVRAWLENSITGEVATAAETKLRRG
jgi:hypothetical protein